MEIRLGHDLRRGRKTLNKIMDRAHAPRVPRLFTRVANRVCLERSGICQKCNQGDK